jgi:hypothetical protein
MQLSRRSTVQQNVTMGVSTVVFSNVEKIITVVNRAVSPYKTLDLLTLEELRVKMPYVAGDTPTCYAIHSHTADTVTIEINCVPQTAFTLYADAHQVVADLSGSNEPAFPESFHDVLIEGVMSDELRKMEKPQMAMMAQKEYERILSDLKFWVVKENALDTYQGKTIPARSAGGSGGSGGGSFDGSQSWTQTGLITFDRDPSAPFAVTSGSAKVDNLDADKLDGFDESAFFKLADNETVTGNTLFSGTAEFDSTVNFDGSVDFDSTVDASGGSFLLPQTTAPAQTAEGSIVWDTDDNLLTVGDGASRKTMVDTSSTQTLTNKTLTSPSLTTPTMTTPVVSSGAVDLQSGQITFPATQAASAGANTLDDYEEGTWTPVIGGSGGTSGQTYTSQTGTYTKIGQLVVAQFNVVLSAKGTITGSVEIQGLPFTSLSTASTNNVAVANWANLATNWVNLLYVQLVNTTVARVRGCTAAAANNSTDLATADINNNTAFIGTIIYRASA